MGSITSQGRSHYHSASSVGGLHGISSIIKSQGFPSHHSAFTSGFPGINSMTKSQGFPWPNTSSNRSYITRINSIVRSQGVPAWTNTNSVTGYNTRLNNRIISTQGVNRQDFSPKGNDWKSRMIASGLQNNHTNDWQSKMIALGFQNNRTKKEEVVNLADPQDFSSKGNWRRSLGM
ncbi:unnamed protein product [Trifolium pratense]|uniref:Uncharacterized protein n=1 Tax=Trifolium pratense TaxID=57577 RepID=A0ACB0KHS7_TRIPR|nr:unnamed protein product [Trifolium pratense]